VITGQAAEVRRFIPGLVPPVGAAHSPLGLLILLTETAARVLPSAGGEIALVPDAWRAPRQIASGWQ